MNDCYSFIVLTILMTAVHTQDMYDEEMVEPYDNTMRETYDKEMREMYDELLKHMNSRHLYHAYTFGSGVGNREDLTVNEVQRDLSMQGARGVEQWKTLKVEETVWLVGVKRRSLYLGNIHNIHEDTFQVVHREIDFEDEVKTAWIFEAELSTAGKTAAVMAVVTAHGSLYRVTWYHLDMDHLTKILEWPMWKKISCFTVFKYNGQYNIAFVQNYDSNKFSLKLYKLVFENNTPHIQLMQSMPLAGKATSLAVTVEAGVLYVTLVGGVKDMVEVFRHEGFCAQSPEGRLSLHTALQVEGVTSAQAFSTASRNYLALNGVRGDVLIFHRNGSIHPALARPLGGVEAWLVLEVHNYRDDVVLLAKNESSVSVLTWAGSLDGFVLKQPPPCYLVDDQLRRVSKLSSDLGCLSGERWEGAGQVDIGSMPSVLFPHQPSSGYSLLYHLVGGLTPLMDPEWDILRLEFNKLKLQEHWNKLKKHLEGYGIAIDADKKKEMLEEMLKKRSVEVKEDEEEEEGYWPSLELVEETLLKTGELIEEVERRAADCEAGLEATGAEALEVVLGEGTQTPSTAVLAGTLQLEKPMIVPRWGNETLLYNLTDDRVHIDGVLTVVPVQPAAPKGEAKVGNGASPGFGGRPYIVQLPPEPQLRPKNTGAFYSLGDITSDKLYTQSKYFKWKRSLKEV